MKYRTPGKTGPRVSNLGFDATAVTVPLRALGGGRHPGAQLEHLASERTVHG